MANENSFDIVSKVDAQEVLNAVEQASKEIRTRFDLKDSKSEIKLEGEEAIQLASSDEYKLQAVTEILQQKLAKRGVSLKALTYGNIEPAAGSSVRQKITLQQGIPIEKSERNREADQGVEKQGAGDHPGRHGSRQQQRPGYAAGYDCIVEEKGFRHRSSVHQLPVELALPMTDGMLRPFHTERLFEHSGHYDGERSIRTASRRPGRDRAGIRA